MKYDLGELTLAELDLELFEPYNLESICITEAYLLQINVLFILSM